MISHNTINSYVLATCTGLSYLGLQSLANAQTKGAEVMPSNNSLSQESIKIISTENIPSSSLSLQLTSRAELIRKLKRQAIKLQSNRVASLESQSSLLAKLKSPPQTNSDLIRKLKGNTQSATEASLLSLPGVTSSAQPVKTAIAPTTFTIKNVQVLGSSVFSKSEIDAVVKPYIGKQVQFEQLLAIRAAVTDYYTKRGYTTSGAFLPPQDVSSGSVNVQVVEGELERVEIQGLKRLREGYVRSRIQLVAGTPINLRRLETALQLLQVDPLFTSVQAELKSGTTPGRSVLSLTLREARFFGSSFSVENRDSPSVGSVRATSSLSYQNLLGFGDAFTAQVGYTRGANSYDLGYN